MSSTVTNGLAVKLEVVSHSKFVTFLMGTVWAYFLCCVTVHGKSDRCSIRNLSFAFSLLAATDLNATSCY